eukprot:jgi/Bigna1/89211/estExt_fgenesh1_pg.C_450116
MGKWLLGDILGDDEVAEIVFALVVDSAILGLACFALRLRKPDSKRRADLDDPEHVSLVKRNSDPLYETAKASVHFRTPSRFRFQTHDQILGPFLEFFRPLGRHLREAALYLRFHALACCFFVLLSIVNVTVLVPIYAYSPGNIYSHYKVSMVEKFTASNVSVASLRLLVSFLAIVAFTAMCWVFIRQYYGDIVQLVQVSKMQRDRNDVTAHTVLFKNLPPPLVSEQLLLEHLKSIFGSSDDQRGTGHAFACFTAPMYAREAIELYSGNAYARRRLRRRKGPVRTLKGRMRKRLDDSRWRAEPAPQPSDVVWENLTIGDGERGARGVAINVLLFVLMTMIIAPVAVVARLEPLVETLEDVTIPDKLEHREMRKFVGNYFPTLVVFTINAILLPFLIDITSHLEGHKTESARSAAVVRRNAVFQFINTILLPSLALNSAAAAIRLAYRTNFAEWERIIGNSLQKNTSARFFMIYLIHATLLGCASEVAQIPQMALQTLRRLRSCVLGKDRSLDTNLERPWEFDFGYFYGARLTIMGLVLLYSVLVPIIAPVGAVYFLMNYWTDGHNLRTGVYSVSFDSNGALPLSVLRYILWYITLFLFSMSCYFTVQGTLMFFVLGMLLMMLGAVSLCCTMLQWRPDSMELEDDFEDGLNDAEEQEGSYNDVKQKGGKANSPKNIPKNPSRDRSIMYEFLRSYVCPFQVPAVSVLQDPSSDITALREQR